MNMNMLMQQAQKMQKEMALLISNRTKYNSWFKGNWATVIHWGCSKNNKLIVPYIERYKV